MSTARSRGVLGISLAALAGLLVSTSSAQAGEFIPFGSVSGGALYSPDQNGELQKYASGMGVALAWIQPNSKFSPGFEVSTLFLGGPEDERVYDLGLSLIVSFAKIEKKVAPFMLVGLDITGVSAPDIDRDRQRTVMAGVHAGAGLHGMFGKNWYWRGQAGFLGAGPGGVTGQLSLGYAFR